MRIGSAGPGRSDQGNWDMIIAFFKRLAQDHCGDSFVNLALVAPIPALVMLAA